MNIKAVIALIAAATFTLHAAAQTPLSLIGEAAPKFQLNALDGTTVTLDQHAGKQPVVIDFWATWCGPCVRALPMLQNLAERYQDKAAFYAVNIREDRQTVRRFIDDNQLTLPVLFDTDGSVAETFNVRGIPQTVLIDTEGRVFSVHVGFSPDMEQTLALELDATLAGKASGELQNEAAQRRADELQTRLLTKRQISDTPYIKAAASHHGRHVTLIRDDGAIEIRTQNQTRLIEHGDIPHEFYSSTTLINLNDGTPILAGARPWGQDIRLFDPIRQTTTAVNTDSGFNDAAAADLDGDGNDELIIGHNGNTGIKAFGFHNDAHEPTPLWHNRTLGNIWTIDAADVTGDDAPEIICTSATGNVHILSASGQRLADIEIPIYATVARPLPRQPDQDHALIAVYDSDGRLAVINHEGRPKWKRKLEPSHRPAILPSPDAAQLAFHAGEELILFDNANGNILGYHTLDPGSSIFWADDRENGKTTLHAASTTGLIQIEPAMNN